MRELSPGAEVGGYQIEAVVGRGGMGVVYRARQRRPQRTVALKVVAPELADNDQFRARFERESDLAARIEHPNVIPVYEVGEDDDLFYIVMRYVEGSDLRGLVEREGRLAPGRAAGIVAQVADALDAAHRLGLVHRDIKPANVLIAPGHTDHAYLTDFGLVKTIGSETGHMTATGAFVGTLDYIAPEQLEGRVDARSDVYALGGVLFHALTGRAPYPQPTPAQKMWAQMNAPPPSVSELAPDAAAFDQVVARAMAKSPADRYPSAGDLGRAALAAATNQSPARAETSVAAGPAAPTEAAGPPPVPPPPAPGPEAVTPHGARPQGATVSAPAWQPVTTGPAAPEPKRGGGRAALLVAAGAVLLVALAALAAVLLLGGDDDGGAELKPDDVALVGDVHITRAQFDHWRDIAAKQEKATKDPKKLRDQSMEFLIGTEWIEQEAKRRGVSATDAEVRERFEREKDKAFTSESQYREFLRDSGQTEADILFRTRSDLLSDRIQKDVLKGVPAARKQKTLDDFAEKDFQRRYKAITECRDGFVVKNCRTGPPMDSGDKKADP